MGFGRAPSKAITKAAILRGTVEQGGPLVSEISQSPAGLPAPQRHTESGAFSVPQSPYLKSTRILGPTPWGSHEHHTRSSMSRYFVNSQVLTLWRRPSTWRSKYCSPQWKVSFPGDSKRVEHCSHSLPFPQDLRRQELPIGTFFQSWGDCLRTDFFELWKEKWKVFSFLNLDP